MEQDKVTSFIIDEFKPVDIAKHLMKFSIHASKDIWFTRPSDFAYDRRFMKKFGQSFILYHEGRKLGKVTIYIWQPDEDKNKLTVWTDIQEAIQRK